MPTTVLISRPKGDADTLKQAILSIDRSVQVVLAPAIEIVPVTYDAHNEAFDALLLTSKHAASAAAIIAPDLPTLCVGDATALAASALGLNAVSAMGTAQDLIALVQKSAVSKVLYLRGAHVHMDLENTLNSAGIETKSLIVYQQHACAFLPQVHRDISKMKSLLVPVYSARSAQIVSKNLDGFKGQVTLVAISKAAAMGWFGAAPHHISYAEAPNSEAMLAAIASQLA